MVHGNKAPESFESAEALNEVGNQWNALKDVPFRGSQSEVTPPEPSSEDRQPDGLRHPRANQLNALQNDLRQAEVSGDTETANGIRNAMKMVIDRNRLEITPEQWDSLSHDDRGRFYKLKMQEAKILGDKDEFDFWNANYKNHNGENTPVPSVEQLEEESPKFEVVSFAEIAKALEDPRYEELGHGTISAENAQSILREGLNVGGPGRDTDVDSNFMPLANNNFSELQNSAENWQHNNAKFIVLYRIPFEYKLPTANMHGSETYKMFYEPDDSEESAKSGKYSKDFAYAYLDVNTGLAYKNTEYKGDLDDPAQKAAMEDKYQFLRNETANKIADPEERESFLAMAENWHEMGENMMQNA